MESLDAARTIHTTQGNSSDRAELEHTLSESSLASLAARVQAKRNTASAPPATRVTSQARPPRAGGSRMRVGGRKPVKNGKRQ